MTFDRYRRIFRQRSFTVFWVGFTLSDLGDGMTRVALIWYVYAATHSAQAVGWLLLCYTGPIVIGGFLAGVLLDRFERRQVMLADNLLRGSVMALIPLLALSGQLALWHVYTAAAIYGLLMMISLAGSPALIPTLVPEEDLPTANALEMLSFTIGNVVGPPLAGWLIAGIGAPYVVTFDAISYSLFALALFRIRPLGAQSSKPAETTTYRFADAVRLLLGSRVLLATTLMFMAFNIGTGLLSVWLPILADQSLGGGSGLYGTLLGAEAAGEVTSALLVGGILFRLPLGALICVAQCLSGLALLLTLPLRSAWGVGVSLALFGLCSAPLTIWAQTLRMRIIPPDLRGRSFALLRTIMQGGRPLGGAFGGLLLPLAGIPAMIALSALVAGLPGLMGLQSGELRRADRSRQEHPAAPPHDTGLPGAGSQE
jgi:MFS family permease